MLEAVLSEVPEIYNFCHLAYNDSSILKFGEHSVWSAMGPQQGDPLGPLLFCLTIQPILNSLRSNLTVSFLDDLTLGGPEFIVADDVNSIIRQAASVGLELNVQKCEIICSPMKVLQEEIFGDFIRFTLPQATLLGAPLFKGSAMDEMLNSRCEDLRRAVARLKMLSAHDALLMLKSAISAPKVLYIMRASPCFNHPSLELFDDLLREGLSSSANIIVSDLAWLQASLPVKDGGLGIRSVVTLAPSAYLASAAGTLELQNLILQNAEKSEDTNVHDALMEWTTRHSCPPPADDQVGSQRQWDRPSVNQAKDSLLNQFSDNYNRARILATASPNSSAWLSAFPISACGLRLDDGAIHVAVGLRLGVPICEPHECPCGSQVDARGSHCLSCRRSKGRMQRHQMINDIIYRALLKADIPSSKEPSGISRSDGKRPDGVTLHPWKSGKPLTWDVTVIDTIADSYLASTSTIAGGAAEIAAARKCDKYNILARTYEFCPIAFETLGPINEAGSQLLFELGRRISAITGDAREHSFLLQRISIAIQRCNAVSFRGCFVDTSDDTS